MFFEKMQTRKNDGFTLVELIVVIAILAILAGIAVPAYSGYIEKANVAADEQLLHAINTAFAAATSGNGVVATNADLPIAADGTVNPATLSVTPASDKVVEDFKTFYAGNESSAFKIAEDLLYNDGVFKIVGKGIPLTLSYAGGNITISYDDLAKFKDSAFATEIGAESLLIMVDAAAGLIGSIEDENSTLRQLAYGTEAIADLLKNLNVSSEAEIAEILTAKYPQGEMSDEDYSAFIDQKFSDMIANNAVLYAAKSTNGSVSSYMEVLKATNVKETIKTAPDDASMMSQSAMAFAMYSAYTGKSDMENLNLLDVYSTLDSNEFKAYLETPQATADLEGYLASMNMVNSGVTSDTNAAVDVLLNGFTSPELEGLLNQLAGK